jgi:GDP-D-mannose dehydratase
MMGRRALITDVTGQDDSYLSRASWLASYLSFVGSDMRTIAVLEAVILFTEHDQVAVH